MTVPSHTETIKQTPVAGWLPPKEFRILEAICETLLPSLEPPAGCSEVLADYYRRKASNLDVALHIAETLAQEHAQAQKQFRLWLDLLTNPLTGLLLVGSPHPFAALPQHKRENYLLALANSPLGPLRQGYQVVKRLAGFIFFAVPNEQGVNPNWEVLGYPPPAPPPASAQKTIEPLVLQEETTLEADAVVIGSGAGGSVVAAELAMAGKSVIVLEKGGYNHEANFTLQEAQATPELYLKRGTLTTKDLGIVVLAGSTLGGGTTINWMTSLRTPPEILAEWEQHSGLKGCFTGADLQTSFTAVEQRLHVNLDNSVHNRQNQLLFDGGLALGYDVSVLPRNAIGCEQRCGLCGFGCRYGAKQSTLKTYLQDAYEHGARILVRCSADKVLIEKGQAVAVKATVTDPEKGKTFGVTIHAKLVIVAAGAPHSPAILLRSGVENRHLGRHLHLHPVSSITGIYPEPVYPWQGVIQSAYSPEFAHLDGNYGYRLEVPPGYPGLMGLATPWDGARDYREQMSHAANLATIIVLTRDQGEGTVTIDREGEPVIDYVISGYDRKHLLHGLRQAARIHFAAGAQAVNSLHTKRTRMPRPEKGMESGQQFREFDRQLQWHGLGANRLMMFTAHQMGTCRMGTDLRTSVTDEHMQVHGIKGLFVCDASVFPQASGVNPMLTILALVHRNCQYLKMMV